MNLYHLYVKYKFKAILEQSNNVHKNRIILQFLKHIFHSYFVYHYKNFQANIEINLFN